MQLMRLFTCRFDQHGVNRIIASRATTFGHTRNRENFSCYGLMYRLAAPSLAIVRGHLG